MNAIIILSFLFILSGHLETQAKDFAVKDSKVPTNNYPIELAKIHSKVQKRAKDSKLNLKFIEYIYYLNQGSQRFSEAAVSSNKERLKKALGADFESLNTDKNARAKHEKFIDRRLALYPDLHIRQAMSRASAEQVISDNDFANCADYGKAFVQIGLGEGIAKDNFKVVIFAEKKSFEKVCSPNQKPLLDPNSLSGIYFSFTYTIAYKSKGHWYLINPEANTPEVFSVGKHIPERGQVFQFPFLSNLGASDFVVSGTLDLNAFLRGYDIAEPINLSISGDSKIRSFCAP